MSKYDPRFDSKINVGHSDLYFMIQYNWKFDENKVGHSDPWFAV